MKLFVAGPDCGLEFGWLVARWIPAVRYKAQSYDKTVIICKDGYQDLYEFADEFVIYNKKGKPDRWLLDKKVVNAPSKVRELYPNITKLWLANESHCMDRPLKYYKYGKYDDRMERENGYKLIIHARACTKYGQKKLNWSPENYVKLIKKLKLNKLDVASIGSKKNAHYIPDTIDCRGIPLGMLTCIMANSKCVVGTSSGPMHLASLCGCPHVVLTGASKLKIIKGQTNRDRYEKLWNPFKTKCTIIDKYGWHPPVEAVYKAVRGFV